jgi:hypothetical protein
MLCLQCVLPLQRTKRSLRQTNYFLNEAVDIPTLIVFNASAKEQVLIGGGFVKVVQNLRSLTEENHVQHTTQPG